MDKLYYGNGIVTVSGLNIKKVLLRYKGAVEIDDKSPEGYYIQASSGVIAVVSLSIKESSLEELFEYVGEFKILNAISINKDFQTENLSVKRVMDYSELLNSNAEDLTILSENIKSTHIHGKKISKTILKQPYIENLKTIGSSRFSKEDGQEYSGYYNINISSGKAMSGRVNDENSVKLKPIRNPNVISGAKNEKARRRRIEWRTKT